MEDVQSIEAPEPRCFSDNKGINALSQQCLTCYRPMSNDPEKHSHMKNTFLYDEPADTSQSTSNKRDRSKHLLNDGPILDAQRPAHFSTLRRLRSPWTVDSDGSQISNFFPRESDCTSIRSIDSVKSMAPEFQKNVSCLMQAGLSGNEPENTPASVIVEPIARPFLSFQKLAKVTTEIGHNGKFSCMHVSGGLMAVGFESGATVVFDMSQRIRCMCKTSSSRVTCLSISHDATYLAVGHASGDIYLYDMFQASVPARHVPPVDPAIVLSGKGEGHFASVAIIQLKFVGARKTAIISTDADGLCFYHSLGRILGMASHDTLRVYGRYNATDPSHIYDAAPLPLGTLRHAADDHQFVALILRHKLLIIGLKPSARTWFRSRASSNSETASLAWFPATHAFSQVYPPMLAFSFGSELRVLRVSSVRVKSRTPGDENTSGMKMSEEHLGTTAHPIVQLHWIHRQLLLVATTVSWQLFDFRCHSFTEWQPHDPLVASVTPGDPVFLQIWRSKVFMFAHNTAYAGDFVAWDSYLSQLESDHEYLEALREAMKLYQGTGLGSGIGLPSLRHDQRSVIAQRIECIERKALRLLSDSDDVELIRLCTQIAVEMNNFDLLFGEIYFSYEYHDKVDVFVLELERHIIHGQIRTPPTAVIQRLLEYRYHTHEYAIIEQLILHVDPFCLDLDQLLPICNEQCLWNALSFVYERVFHDYVTPIAQILKRLAQTLTQKTLADSSHHTVLIEDSCSDNDNRASFYAIFPILDARLRGLRYPSMEAFEHNEAVNVVRAVQSLLFSKHAYKAPDLAIVPTLDHNIFPYLRAILNFDAEPFLDVLDLAFESDFFTNEKLPLLSRRDVIDTLLEVNRMKSLPNSVHHLLALFVARNSAKYPQFIILSDSECETIFNALTNDEIHNKDSEFALECLLSAHPIAFTEKRIKMLERAGFWQIYETALRKTKRYPELLCFFLQDRDGKHHSPGQLYDRVSEIFTLPGLKGSSQRETMFSLFLSCLNDIPDPLLCDVARIVTRYFTSRGNEVLTHLQFTPNRQFLYLKAFFILKHDIQGRNPQTLRRVWITRLCEECPSLLVPQLDAYGYEYFDLEHVCSEASTHHVYDALFWALDRRGLTTLAMDQLDKLAMDLAQHTHQVLDDGVDDRADSEAESSREGVCKRFKKLHLALSMAFRLCVENSLSSSASVEFVHELWFRVLYTLVRLEHTFYDSSRIHAPKDSLLALALSHSQKFTQEALATLVTSVPSETISFADLFKRLVHGISQTNIMYSQVRVIVEAMLLAYRLRCDVLMIGVRLNESDALHLFQQLAKERGMGWFVAATRPSCVHCDKTFMDLSCVRKHASPDKVALTPQGHTFHAGCGDAVEIM